MTQLWTLDTAPLQSLTLHHTAWLLAASRAAAAVKWDCTCNSRSRAQAGFLLSGSAAVVPVLVPGSHWSQCPVRGCVPAASVRHTSPLPPSLAPVCPDSSVGAQSAISKSVSSAVRCPLSAAMSLPSAEKSWPCRNAAGLARLKLKLPPRTLEGHQRSSLRAT